MAHVRTVSLTTLLIFLLLAIEARAQRPQFRGSQAQFGVAIGLFTYHGRIDLNAERSGSNFTRSSDPAFILLGSFPIIRDRLFFRGMTGMTNLGSLNQKGAVTSNEFLNRELLWFEPQVVFTPFPGSERAFLPYVYTGFGSLIADPFGGPSSNIDQPNGGTPGPDRSVFTWPLGLGVDFPIGPRFSMFADASYRINFNYVGRNATDRNPHNTSLIMFGMRFNLTKFERVVEKIPPVDLPDPIAIPPYSPPMPVSEFPTDRCVLVDLNTIFFTSSQIEGNVENETLLRENVEALQLNPACCAQIVGFTEGADTESEARTISRERATYVFDFYTQNGIDEDRLALRSRGDALPCLRKEDPECRINRRVESEMLDCQAFPGQRN